MNDGAAWIFFASLLTAYFVFATVHYWKRDHHGMAAASGILAAGSIAVTIWLLSIPNFT